MTSPLQALGIGSFLHLECLPWNVLRLQEGLLTNTGYAQGDNEQGAVSPLWSPFGTSMESYLLSIYMESVQNKHEWLAGVGQLS